MKYLPITVLILAIEYFLYAWMQVEYNAGATVMRNIIIIFIQVLAYASTYTLANK